MAKKAQALDIVMDLLRARSTLVKELERRLTGHSIGLSDLALLMELYDAPDYKLQRIELAERLGITPSGVARQLYPLERIGLVGREADAKDARRALVTLTTAGIRTVEELLPEAQENAEITVSKRWSAAEVEAVAPLLARFRA